jgi:MFS family permease
MVIPHIMLTPRSILLGLVVGAAAGALVALIVDRMLGRGKPALLIDAILGAIGYVGGAIGIAMLPVMQHTTSTRVGDMIIRTTSRRYQDAYRLAFGVAALLAILYELFRYFRRTRTSPDSPKSDPLKSDSPS